MRGRTKISSLGACRAEIFKNSEEGRALSVESRSLEYVSRLQRKSICR